MKISEEQKKRNREILDAWKQEKKEKRQLRKERLKARPRWQKVLSGVGIGVVIVAAAAGIFMLAGGMNVITGIIINNYKENTYAMETMSREEIREGCVIDEEAADNIRSMPEYGADDTWAIYIYMNGSNLESFGENDLSEMVNEISERAIAERKEADTERGKAYIDTYLSALDEAGMEMPSSMYVSQRPEEASSVPVTTDVIKNDQNGAASNDIKEILKADLSDKIDIVIETGGAKRWENPQINPNRVQRFHVKDHALVAEWSKPSESISTVDALSDFLSYCNKNHDADHKFVIFWDHGGASIGYGQDEIYNKMLSLKDMKQAFANVYGEDPEEPPFELIGFDACLMTAAESLDTFENYGKYFVGSEETEPGYGWYYTNWLNALSADTAMNGAQVGLNIADDYMDFYRAQDIKISNIQGFMNVCFSVLDLKKAGEVYDDYEALVKKVLTDTPDDPGALTDLSKAAHESIHYSAPVTEVYNTVDLGIMMDNLSERYPEETGKINDEISKAVLYNRTANNMDGSRGISIYFPDTVTKKKSIIRMMLYLDTITDDDAVKALYFYKAAGCVTDDMRTSLDEMGIRNLKNIHVDALKETSSAEPEVTEEGCFKLKVSEEALKYIQDYRFVLGSYDTENEEILDYGEACRPVAMDESGNLSVQFDGMWPCIDGQPLAAEIIQKHNGIVTFRSSVLLDGEPAYLVYSYNETDGTFKIGGAYLNANQIEGDYVGRNVSDLTSGAKITPVYNCTSSSEGQCVRYGKAVKITKNTNISYGTLPDGIYSSAVKFTDVRCDEFDSQVITFTEKNGSISDTALNEDITFKEI